MKQILRSGQHFYSRFITIAGNLFNTNSGFTYCWLPSNKQPKPSSHFRKTAFAIMAFAVLFLGGEKSWGQLSITNANVAVTQNFDGLPSTGTGLAQSGSIFASGWSFLEGGSNANAIYDAGTGSSTTGNTYSFGVAGVNAVTERAFGMLQSGSLTSILGFKFTNNTGSTVTSLTIGYTGEEWRTAAATDNLAFSYQLADVALNATGWTTVAGLAFATPVNAVAAAVDGNNSSNRTVISPVTLTGLSITNGSTVTLRWVDATGASSAGMGIDDFTITLIAGASSPTVTTDATPSVLSTTAATLGGNVTATGGSAITGNGIVYSLTSANAVPAIGGSGVTQVATVSPGAGTGTFSDATGSVLSVNTQYSYRAYAINTNGTSYGGASGTTFYTLANAPGTPTVNGATSSSLDVLLDANGNPATTQFAIQETTTGNYVQAGGTLAATQVWQTAATWGTKTVSGLTPSTSYTFQVKARNGAVTPVETAFGGTASLSTLAGPSISISATSVSFGNVVTGTNSGEQTYDVSGSNLSANLVVTAPANIEVSTTSGVYTNVTGNSISLTPVSNTVVSTPIYARYTATSASGAFSLTIANASTGATTKNVTATGNAIATEPGSNASPSFVSATSSSISLTNINSGGGTGVIVVAKQGASVTAVPVDGISTYVRSLTFGSGTDLGGSNFIVSQNDGNSITVSNLTPNTQYTFASFDYNGTISTGSENFLTTSPGTVTASTLDVSLASDHFRSFSSGGWATPAKWESSHDSVTWIGATLAPTSASASIDIRNGHTMTVTTVGTTTADQLVIRNGGSLVLSATTGVVFSLNDGTGDDITIQNGGVLQVTGTTSYATILSYSGSADINVNTGGKITIGDGTTGTTGSGYGGFASDAATKVIWGDGAIYELNSSATTFLIATSGVTWFPGVAANVIPVFRVSNYGTTAFGSTGAGTSTVNGLLETNTTMTWASGTGTKTFRNGVIGTGNLVQQGTGKFSVTGTTAKLGGTGTIILSDSMLISSSTSATLISNKAINTGKLVVNGTLDCSTNVISGTGSVSVGSTGTLKVGSLSGAGAIAGNISSTLNALPGGSTVEYNGAGAQFAAARTFGNFTVNNSSGVSLLGDIVANGNVSITSGSLSASTHTISLSGNWANNGIFNAGTSTVEFNGNNNAQTITGTNAFKDVIINHSGTGEVTAAGSTLSVSGLMWIAAGKFTSATAYKDVEIDNGGELALSGDISVSGDWTNNGGTFTHNNYTVVFNGSGTQHVGGTATQFIFHNLDCSGTGDLFLGGATTEFYVEDFRFSLAHKFAPAMLHVDGNWIADGGTFDPNGGTVEFMGSGTQTIGGAAASATFNNVTVNKPAGLVEVMVATAMSGALALTNGKMELNANDLSLSSTASITGASSSSYIVTNGTGSLKRFVNNDDTDVEFTIGTTTYTRVLLRLSSSSTADNIKSRVADNAYPAYDANDVPSGASLPRTVLKTYFETGDIPDQANLTMTTQWNAADESSDFNRAACNLAHYTGGAWSYGHGSAATDLGGGVYSQTRSGITSYSPFAVFGQSITCSLVESGPFCAGTSIHVNYTASGGTWISGNQFKVELSEANGAFSNNFIGTVTSTALSGTITCNIPESQVFGAIYRVRVVSTNPVLNGDDNGSDLTINEKPVAIAGANTYLACVGDEIDFSTNAGMDSYEWSGPNDFTSTDPAPYIYPVATIDGGFYTVIVTLNGCSDTATTAEVFVNTPPTITLGITPSVTTGTTSADLTYASTTGSPDEYSIDYDEAAEAQGFTDVNSTTLPSSPIPLDIPVLAVADTYNAILTVYNTTTGCSSTTDFQIIITESCIEPTALSYTHNPVSYCANNAITTNSPSFTGSAATSYSVSPALPDGLNLNTSTGEITGTPTTPTAAADYTVTVTNGCGNTSVAVNITVNGIVDDANICTTDGCDVLTGLSTHTPLTGPADDGLVCTTGESCSSGTFVAGTATPTDDGNPCTTDGCSEPGGVFHNNVSNGSPGADDGFVCTNDVCVDGSTVHNAVTTDDGNPCTTDGCSEPGGVFHNNVSNGSPGADDGFVCTNDICVDGSTVHNAVTTDDGNPCTTDGCSEPGGVFHNNVSNGSPGADDGFVCTNDVCVDGSTVHNAVTTDDGNPCTTDGCSEPGGVFHNNVANGSPGADDGFVCTNDICVDGSTVHNAVTTDDGNPCTTDGCSEPGGVFHNNVSNGSPGADDGFVCTNDVCVDGSTVHNAVTTDDGNPCTTDGCSEPGGVFHNNVSNGSPGADDGFVCTNDVCVDGSTVHNAVTTDDGNPCTTDGCSEPGGVFHNNVANGSPGADDGFVCTNDICVDGSTVHNAVTTDDGNPCTADGCSEPGGVFHNNVANGSPGADDGFVCTNDVCVDGSTVHNAVTTDDGNPCTTDGCSEPGGVFHNNVSNGSPGADDGFVCTNDICVDGSTVHNAVTTDDGNPCTADGCSEPGGVFHNNVANGSPGADDGFVCTNDVCVDGSTVHNAVTTDDGNPCTTDGCSEPGGIFHNNVSNGSPGADDGFVCTNDICQDGATIHPAVTTDDSDPCTTDGCVEPSGIYHTSNAPVYAPITGANSVCIGGNITLENATPGGNWYSDDEASASIDISTGIVTGIAQSAGVLITYTVTNDCGSVSSTHTIAVNDCSGDCTDPVVVNAGPDIHVCVEGEVGLGGIISGAVTTGTWSGGAGIFSDPSDLNSSYTPDVSEAGTVVTLYLTSDDPGAPCTAGIDSIKITVDDYINLDAGPAIHTCISGEVGLSGLVWGGASQGYWTGGAGTFSPDASTLNATYTPDESETGTIVTLYLNPVTNGNVCPFEPASIEITVDALPLPNAGNDASVCYNGSIQLNGSVTGGASAGHWSGGLGTFTPDRNTLNATYSPDPSENETVVQLYLVSDNLESVCPPDSDLVEITVENIFVDAGPDIHTCVTGEVGLNGIISGGVSTGHWHGGAGVFSDANALNSTYTPDISEVGTSFYLYLTSDGSLGCGEVTDSIKITVDDYIYVDAGPDIHTCINGEVGLSGLVFGAASTGYWTGGAGTFSDNQDLNATYTPAVSEIGSVVTLTLHPNTGDNVCPVDNDEIEITVDSIPVANAGSDQTICDNVGATLSGYVSGGVYTGTWTSSGDGNFSPDEFALNATYNPGPTDISNGTVTLTLTPDTAGACVVSADDVEITINHTTHNSFTVTQCESYTWTGGTETTYTVSGTYLHSYNNGLGCPSTDTLHLTINYGTHNAFTVMQCDSYTWTGGTETTYTVSGTYLHTYNNGFGCSSTDTLHLTINYSTHNSTTVTQCGSYVWTAGTGATYSVSGTYLFNYNNESGCPSTDTLHLNITGPCTATLSMNMFIQGYYQSYGSSTPMDNQGLGGLLYVLSVPGAVYDDVDTITVSLVDSTIYANTSDIVASTFAVAKGILQTNGSVNITFPGSVSGNSYYIKVTHRNALETWSANTVPFTSLTTYDFTDAADKAYGNNMVKMLPDNKWAFYSGDVYDSNSGTPYVQDGAIESNDYGLIEADYQGFLSGYIATDVTGDGVVESADYGLIEANYQAFIATQHP